MQTRATSCITLVVLLMKTGVKEKVHDNVDKTDLAKDDPV
jgi:hypothetical protein